MGKIRTVKTAFVSGELAQQVFGRIDKDFYFKGADKLRNVYVDPLGGVYKREGMRFIDSCYGTGKAKLIEFTFNTEQIYVLVFTDKRMRVYKDDVMVAEVTAATPMNDITEARLSQLKYTQSADTLIIVHPEIKPIKIVRTSHTNWIVEYIAFDFIPSHAFNGVNAADGQSILTFSSLIGRDVIVTAEQATVVTRTVYRYNGLSSGLVTESTVINVPDPIFAGTSKLKQYIVGKKGGIFLITGKLSDTEAVGEIIVEFPSGDSGSPLKAEEWQFETGYEDVWSDIRGYPFSCSFYQGRLWFGGSVSRPSTLWGSRTDLFFDFNIGGGKADNAIDVTIDDDKVNAIVNVFAGRNLQIFTTGGEFYVPQTENNPIKPENIMIQKSTLHGSNVVKPVSVDGGTIFIERSGRVVRQFVFDEVERSYNAQSISLLSSQLIQIPVAMVVRQSRDTSPADYVYIVNSDGTIAVLNILRSEQLLAWSLFETKGFVEDIVVAGRDVYVITKRTINNVEKRFFEKLDKNYYLDAGKKSIEIDPETHHVGFNELAGQDVKVRAGSFVLEDNTVNVDGSIDIELDYKEIEVGLGFEVLIRMLPVDIDLGGKTLTGDWRRIVYVLVKTFRTRSFELHSGRIVVRPVFRSLGSNLLDAEITPYNGWKKIYLSGGIKRDATFDIIQNEPVDFDLVSVVIAVTI